MKTPRTLRLGERVFSLSLGMWLSLEDKLPPQTPMHACMRTPHTACPVSPPPHTLCPFCVLRASSVSKLRPPIRARLPRSRQRGACSPPPPLLVSHTDEETRLFRFGSERRLVPSVGF